MNDGLVDRDELERKQDTALSAEDHLLVEPGDIAYNMMRMWQGAFGLADREGMVSPAYVVLRPKSGIDPDYATYLLRTPRMMYLLWAYSYGLTDDRLRLYFQDFAKIPAWIHANSEQGRIASILKAGDQRIRVQSAILKNTMLTRRALRDRLLKPKSKIYRCLWKDYELSEIADRVRSTFDPSRAVEQTWCVELEHVESELGQLLGSTATTTASSTKVQFESGDVLFGKLRPYLRKYWLASRAGVCSSEFWVLRANSDLCTPSYLACLLQSDPIMRAAAASAGSKMPRAEWDYVASTTVQLPPLHEQEMLAGTLEPLDDYVKRLRTYVEVLCREQRQLAITLLGRRSLKSSCVPA